jgi:hypothetical protein
MIPARSAAFPKNAFLAALPVLFQLSGFSSACFLAVLIYAAYVLTILLFVPARPLFPKPFFYAAILVWMAALGQAAWYVWLLKPFWMASLGFLLLDPVSEKKAWPSFQAALLQGLGIAGLLIFIGAAAELLSRYFPFSLFLQAPGLLFLLALAAWVWQWKGKGQAA